MRSPCTTTKSSQPPLTATREGPRAATKTQRSQKKKKKKTKLKLGRLNLEKKKIHGELEMEISA